MNDEKPRCWWASPETSRRMITTPAAGSSRALENIAADIKTLETDN